jgi:radical SAM-linked protein
MWERAFRRVQLPVAYSGGFAPRPKVSFGLALPTGCESMAEYLDVELTSPVDVEVDRLSAALPVGVDVLGVAPIDDRADSLQQEVTSCTWTAEVAGTDAPALVEAVLAAETLPATRERKGRPVTDDLRPSVLHAAVSDPGELIFELATQPRGVRPTEVLAVVAPQVEIGLVRRTHQWIERDGARWEPLSWHPPAATDAHEKGSPCPTRTMTSLSRPPLTAGKTPPAPTPIASAAGADPVGAAVAAAGPPRARPLPPR